MMPRRRGSIWLERLELKSRQGIPVTQTFAAVLSNLIAV
jgi:hypothetical protein